MPGPIVIDNEAGTITIGGTPLGSGGSGFPDGFREGLDISQTGKTQLTVGAGSCRSQDNTQDIMLGSNTTISISSLATGTYFIWIAKVGEDVSLFCDTGYGTPVSPPASSTYRRIGQVVVGISVPHLMVGGDQLFPIPAGVTFVTAKMWGAGGGGGSQGGWDTVGSSGGAGGFVTADLAVTPGEIITVIVGESGKTGFNGLSATPTYGGGGGAAPGAAAVDSNAYAASGGGRSAIRAIRSNTLTELLTAGGGGGGGSSHSGGTPYTWGGVGGSLEGASASQGNAYGGWNQPAGGGTQTSGGTRALTNRTEFGTDGSQFQGGGPSVATYGGGGGGGYYGGGGGALASGNVGWWTYVMGGGGGGSSYIGGVGVSNASTVSGVSASTSNPYYALPPGNIVDPEYASGIGYSGQYGQNGGNGRVVLTYNQATNTY